MCGWLASTSLISHKQDNSAWTWLAFSPHEGTLQLAGISKVCRITVRLSMAVFKAKRQCCEICSLSNVTNSHLSHVSENWTATFGVISSQGHNPITQLCSTLPCDNLSPSHERCDPRSLLPNSSSLGSVPMLPADLLLTK